MKQILLCTLLLLTPIHGYGMEENNQQLTNRQQEKKQKRTSKKPTGTEDDQTPKGCFAWIMHIIATHPHDHNALAGQNCPV